jgi:cobalt/nickel transport system permease protein
MHIPDGFLSPPVWGTFDVISGSFVVGALRQVGRRVEEKAIPLMGVLSAFVFAAQMINLPIAGGTSAHFLGAALVGILLGPWAGLTIITVVLLVQCFLFQDGGVAALGANIFDMGVVGSVASYFLYQLLVRVKRGADAVFWAGFWSAWISVFVSSVSCAAMLAVSGVVSWKVGLSVISGVHAIMGLLEGIVTGTVLQTVSRSRPDLFNRSKI